MSNADGIRNQPADRFGRLLLAASRALAIFGGLVLCAMAVVTTASVTGRSLSSVSTYFAPITGDFELIEIGTGIAVFAFLPYCQMRRDNVIVDFFLNSASPRTKAFFDILGSLAYGAIVVLFAWRTSIGGVDLYDVGESTYMLGIPRWWTFPFAVFCLVFLAVVCAYTVTRNAEEFRGASPSR